MKILMIGRSNWFKSVGGDTIQAEKTAFYLRKLGVEVDIWNEDSAPNYKQYDALHFFNIIRPNVILAHCMQSATPFVVSSIYVDYTEVDKIVRGGSIGVVQALFGHDTIEYIKTIARAILRKESLGSFKYIIKGHRNSIQFILNKSSMILPNSESEGKRLFKDYGTKVPYKVIPNGIDLSEYPTEINEGKKSGIICVGRIEQRKNQLNLIRAVQQTKFHLTIIGDASPNQKNYYLECRNAANETPEQIDFLPFSDTQTLITHYQKAKVHALPSWFETTGLVNLEAAFCGCNIVITNKGDTSDYFEDKAFYCEPNDINSIASAITEAYESPFKESIRQLIVGNYNWQNAAEKTLEAYKEVLND
jgi:glycosyltransferase involved in cell wall biosynthesis